MKLLPLLALLPLLSLARTWADDLEATDAASAAGVVIKVPEAGLFKETSLEVRFPGAMVPDATVGQSLDAASVLSIAPPLKGTFIWRSRYNGTFQPTDLPPLGAKYTIGLNAKLKDSAGQAPPLAKPVIAPAPEFQVRQSTPSWFSSAERQPQVFFFFNDAVDAASVASHAAFVDKSGQRIPVAVTLPTSKALGNNTLPVGSYEEQFRGTAKFTPQQTVPSVARIVPSQPLPPGEKWQLQLEPGISNQSKSVATTKRRLLDIGTIAPMQFTGVYAESPLDETRYLNIAFNKALPKDTPVDVLKKFIVLEPLPEELVFTSSGSSITITGDFEINSPYKVTVLPGVVAADGLKSARGGDKEVTFTPHEASIGLPAFSNTQWIGGKREFGIDSANNSKVTVSMKRIDPTNIVYALRGYNTYEHDESSQGSTTRIPYAAMPGKTVWQKDFPTTVDLDHSEHFSFNWDEALGGPKAGVYFISVEGKPKTELSNAAIVGAQSLVQLTDIGLAWKTSEKSATVFAFSHTTGQPLKEVQLASFDDDANPLDSQTTDASGLATLKLTDKSRWLVAVGNQDWHGIEFKPGMGNLDMWNFDVNYSDPSDDDGSVRDTIFFTDRPLYQPGETVFLKVITRKHTPDGLSIHPNKEARLRGYDLNQQVFVEKKVTISESGTYADIIKLPENGVGSYHFELDFFKSPEQLKADAEKARKEAEENGESEETAETTADANAADAAEGEDGEEVAVDESDKIETSVEHYIIVQEYQPNAFKITMDAATVKLDGEVLNTPVKAAYFMGKPLSEATLKWNSTINQAEFSAEKFKDYKFCNAKSYNVFDGENWQELDREDWHNSLATGQGEVKLDAKGNAMIPAGVPATFGVVGPKTVTVDAEITDLNQQTIASNLSHTINSSQFYIGVRESRRAFYSGSDVPVEMVAVTPEGTRYAKPVAAKMLVERLVWNAVKIETAGGGNDIRHDLKYEKQSETDISISPETAKELVTSLKPAKAGTYNITVTAKDDEGKAVVTVVSFDVYGGEENATWAQREGVKIDLTADKDSYKPGDTAKIIVKSPFKGTALISVEREKVLKSWLAQVDGKGGVIEVPIEDAFAPNCFVSVMQIRGGAEDPREFKQPDYKVGICALKVESHKNDLTVELVSEQPEFRPGAPVGITAIVKDSSGQPVPNAEVALWAADEGILSLVAYEMPDVMQTFSYEQPLRVSSGISLVNILSEDPEQREYANKGFVIGGGGEDAEGGDALRKNFKPLAYWNAGLKTGVDGKVTVSFTAPDSLTQYRVQAIVNEGVNRFGQAESNFKINKPLMLEPAMPRFANVGDEIMLKAVVHNTTQTAGEIEISLTLDDHVELIKAEKPNAATKKLSVGAGQSKATFFPVRFIKTGEAISKWSAVAVNGPKEMKDAVQNTLEVGTTEPMLRDIRFLNVGENAAGKNLLQTLSPELLDGSATITLSLSNSRVVEASGAIEQLLHYPYGCAEQTTSALLPWLALKDLKGALPSLKKTDAEIAAVIQKGADRLLSMQTGKGGLAYWPKGEEPSLWASAQGGMGLLMAKKAGASVPDARLSSVLRYLSKSLRSESDETDLWNDYTRAFACYTLALGGKAEPAYHEKLYQEKAKLSSTARAMLALAIAESEGPSEMAMDLLGKVKDEGRPWNWLGADSERAVRALAWLRLKDEKKANAAIEEVLNLRAPRGDWKNTYNNGWVVQAMAAFSKNQQPWSVDQPGTLTFNGSAQAISFGPDPASQTITFTTKGGGELPTLNIKVPAGKRLYGRVEVAARATKNLDQGRASGFAIARSYQKIDATGAPQPGKDYHVGDLLLVTLALDVPGDSDYLAIDDPLPATLEGVNPEFATMANNANAGKTVSWSYDHQEMRRDRVLYFKDQFIGSGRFHVQYLARVVAEGSVTSPASRIEAMYDPSKFGLSPAEKLTTLGGDEQEVAGK